MKRVGFLMEEIASLDNLYLAYQKARRGKQNKCEVKKFAADFDENIKQLRDELLSCRVKWGNCHFFKIKDPKERTICAAPFRERVLQHAIMNICHKFFDRTLIDTTYATRKGKGVYAALEKAQKGLRYNNYCVKLDFRKYYDSIDHEVLKRKLQRLFKDAGLLKIFDDLIDSYEVNSGKGLPIGNLTSQYFANFYLSELDHLAKEKWKFPVYIRYMDDILIAARTKDSLKTIVTAMTDYSQLNLNLTLKPPIYTQSKNGQVFLGYKVKPYYMELSGRSKRRFRTKILQYNSLLRDGKWQEGEYEEHILPLLSFTSYAVCEDFRRECMIIKGNNQIMGQTA